MQPALATEIAQEILNGFNKHYRLFREISAAAKAVFEEAEWSNGRQASRKRISMYDQRVTEAVAIVRDRFPSAGADEALWPQIKQAYISLLYEHKQPECAETFFNSVACRVLDRRYYHNEYIFWRPAVSTEHIVGDEPVFQIYPVENGDLRSTLRVIAVRFALQNAWQDLERDLACVERAVQEHFGERWTSQPDFAIHVLTSLFYRNKAAYIVGRARVAHRDVPFVVPILQDGKGELILDTLLITNADIGRLFDSARAYFMVDMEIPSAYVSFLMSILPGKPASELYTILGLQKQGKTLFYRDLHEHLVNSTDKFGFAPGTKGMVMVVFTLPSFPFVFKIIRDWFPPPKDTDRQKVEEKYWLVKMHDRVGRMADTLEFSHVAFPVDRFDPAVIEELKTVAPSMIQIEDDQVIISHMYIERRMMPLDLYVLGADEHALRETLHEFGECLRDLASANIFPGDLLLKNFGVTRFGRIVFYDYDEIGYLTDYKFRRLPESDDMEDEMREEPFFAVGPHDVFPQQFPTFLFAKPRAREIFNELHADLADPRFWIETQEGLREDVQGDIWPYSQSLRFRERYRAKMGL